MPLELVRNDITRMAVDAIVNAANKTLLGGGGVDGAIHRAAGPELLAECRGLGGCETGEAKITRGYRLPCRYVIHTVGPVWQGGRAGEEELLRSCYLRSLELAAQYGCETVAFPLISSGAYGYPKDQALCVATDAVRDFLLTHEMTVFLVIFDSAAFAVSRKLYARIQTYIDDAFAGRVREAEERRRQKRLEAADFEDALPTEGSGLFLGREASAPAPADAGLEAFLRQTDEGFRDMLLRKIDESGMTDAECYKRANVDRKLFSKIKNQPDYRPGKSTVLAFAVALRLPLEEARKMLERAGFSLSRSSRSDLIVEYFIRQGVYDVFTINEALFAFDEKLLGSAV